MHTAAAQLSSPEAGEACCDATPVRARQADAHAPCQGWAADTARGSASQDGHTPNNRDLVLAKTCFWAGQRCKLQGEGRGARDIMKAMRPAERGLKTHASRRVRKDGKDGKEAKDTVKTRHIRPKPFIHDL